MTTGLHRRRFLAATSGAVLLAPFHIRASQDAKPRIRVGQIGTGHAHADGQMAAMRKSPDFEVVGFVEPDERLRAVRALEKNPAYQGVPMMTEEQLLNTPGLRMVAVETEVKDLLATGTRCVRAGMHIHLDKPAGESLPQFKALLDEAARRKLTVKMGYMFRYNAAFEFCYRIVREGWLGRVFSIETAIGKISSAADRAKLLPYRGGTMFELGCHVIDSVVHLLGRPHKVTAFARRSGAFKDDLLDNQLAVLEYPGATVTVRSALVEVDGGARRHFVVCGDAGTFDIRPLEPPKARLALAQPRGEFKKGYQDVPFPSRPRYEADFADMAKVIRGEKKFDWSPEHDLAAQETVLLASGLPVT
jgi:predicted dehydrogenase